MEPTFQCSQFVVFDDVLSAAQFESLWRYFQLISLSRSTINLRTHHGTLRIVIH